MESKLISQGLQVSPEAAFWPSVREGEGSIQIYPEDVDACPSRVSCQCFKYPVFPVGHCRAS